MRPVFKSFLLLGAFMLVGARGAAAQAPVPPAGLAIPKDMTPYFVAFLVKGEKFSAEQTPEHAALIVRHLAFIKSMFEQKVFQIAGPFGDGGRILGMVVLTAKSLDDARRILEQDPDVAARQAAVEVHPAMFPSLAGIKVSY